MARSSYTESPEVASIRKSARCPSRSMVKRTATGWLKGGRFHRSSIFRRTALKYHSGGVSLSSREGGGAMTISWTFPACCAWAAGGAARRAKSRENPTSNEAVRGPIIGLPSSACPSGSGPSRSRRVGRSHPWPTPEQEVNERSGSVDTLVGVLGVRIAHLSFRVSLELPPGFDQLRFDGAHSLLLRETFPCGSLHGSPRRSFPRAPVALVGECSIPVM